LILVQGVAQVDNEFLEEALANFAYFVLNVQQELSQHVVYEGSVSLVLLWFIFLFVLFPILFDSLYIKLIIFVDLLYFAVSFSFLLAEGKKFYQIFLK